MTYFPTDRSGHPVPALSLKSGGGHAIAFTDASDAVNAIAFSDDTRVISIWSDSNFYIELGGEDVVVPSDGTEHVLNAPSPIFISIGDGVVSNHKKFIAVKGVSDSGTLYVSEWE